VGSPANGFPAGTPSSAIIGSPKTGLPAGAPAGAIVGTPFNRFPGGSPSRATTGSSGASLTQSTNTKAAPKKASTTNLPHRTVPPRTNNPAPRPIYLAPSTNHV
jgi:hypothetical protein